MKKLALTLAIILGLSMASFAEGGGLFGQGQAAPEESNSVMMTTGSTLFAPKLPDHYKTTNQPAPLGSGIAVLVGLGAAYAASKKRKD